jgi:hypothetical protein
LSASTPPHLTDPGNLPPFSPREGRLSKLIDRATAQLEAAQDPEVVAIYRRLVAELEALIA